MTSGTYPLSFVTQTFHNGQPSHGGDQTFFEVMTSTLPKGTLGSVASLIAAAFYQGNPDRNHKLWNIVSTEIYTGRHDIAGILLKVALKHQKSRIKIIDINDICLVHL
jgi:hypothetical protein